MWFVEYQFPRVFNIELSFLLFVSCFFLTRERVFEREAFMLSWFSGQRGFVKDLSF